MTELIKSLKKIAEELGAIDQTLNSLLVIYAGTLADKDAPEPLSITVPESRDSYTYIHNDYTDLAISTSKESK